MSLEELPEVDAAYIAGLIDGEGTVTLTRKHRNENRQLAVTISSTERNLLDFVKETLGVGKITQNGLHRPTTHPATPTPPTTDRRSGCLNRYDRTCGATRPREQN